MSFDPGGLAYQRARTLIDYFVGDVYEVLEVHDGLCGPRDDGGCDGG